MRPYEKQILEKRLKEFQYEVIPNELLPFLPCLIPEDKEEIKANQTNHGAIRATEVLVDRLKRRHEGFQNFVQALRKCGSEHTALLLDPNYDYRDVAISGNLLPEGCEVQTESFCEIEHDVADIFSDQKSSESKRMRKELQKHLPKGAAFVNTSRGSIILTFRLSSEQAANELWDMYTEGEFQSMLQTVFVKDALKDLQKEGLEKTPKLELNLCTKTFKKIRDKLKEIESEQESDRLLSIPRKSENGRVEDSEQEMEFIIPEASSTSNRKKGRVVFIVSTVNLVLQQKERFDYFFGGKYSVGEISGANSTEIPLKYLLQDHNVVVMTAQILVNALNNENKDQRVELKDISLLLFDECHHANKEHPYNNIMGTYLALKSQPGYQHSLPQIVGLTASLGAGRAPSRDKAEEHIILVSANLDAEAISTVRENRAELQKYANIPDQETFVAEKSDQDPFEKIISKVMEKIENQLKRMSGKSFKAGPPDKGGQQYRQWVEELYKDAVAVGDRYLVTYTEHLREYHISLTLNSNTRMKNARKYLQKYFDSLDREKFTEADENLEKLFHKAMEMLDKFIQKNGEPENPQLMKLKELLLGKYKEPQQGDNGQQTKANQNKKEDGTRRNSANENCLEREGNTMDAINGDVELSKLADENATERAYRQGEKEGKGHGHDENAVNGDEMRECSGKEKDEIMERTSPDKVYQDDKVGKSVSEILCVHEQDTAGSSSSCDKTVHSHEESDSEAMGDLDDDMAESSSSDTANEEDKAKKTKARHHPEWEGPKGILFTRTRESTEALLDWIKETEELKAVLRPVLLVGSGDGNIGMTQIEQERVIKMFKTGENNLLLATSVAEEGLDISDCNYVIRYDMMGNEISLVQSRGRVRAECGKYSVLVGHSGARKRQGISALREMLMTVALNKVQEMDPEEFKKKVKDVQKKILQDRCLKKNIYALRTSEPLPHDVSFRCRKCQVFVCQAHDVRRIQGSHHVIIDINVRNEKVDIKHHNKPKKTDGIEMNKKIFCKNCGEDWGVTALISGVEWLCIKIRSFVLEFPEEDQPRKMFKKWKDLPFGIKEASMEDILKHSCDKGPGNDLLDFNFDV
ncbi:ATP-dependent RNA helicase DHX58-like isoform X3 [Porites lutea]|uniref:ATP-dependent RNA helicase DHX58-like isoform X3 n=1 Tax=Porites lutea TaxID=51062 RepID=UPI003CC635D6